MRRVLLLYLLALASFALVVRVAADVVTTTGTNQQAGAAASPMPSPAPQLIFVGDSITTQPYADKVLSCLAGNCSAAPPTGGSDYYSTRYATSGFTLVQMGTSYDAAITTARNSTAQQTIILLGGTNDMALGADAATTFSRVQARVSSYRSAGYTRIVVLTVLPCCSIEAARQLVNTSIRSGSGAGTWSVADVGADPTIGAPGANGNTTYYSDGVHPTAAGYSIMAPLVAAAVNSF